MLNVLEEPRADQTSGAFQLKDEKSVSRQHLTLSVANVKPGDGVSLARGRALNFANHSQSLVHTRSEVSLKDEGTKFGTEIDGSKVRGETRVLNHDEHDFKLGKSIIVFRYAYSFSSKHDRLTSVIQDQKAPSCLHVLPELQRDESRQRSLGELPDAP